MWNSACDRFALTETLLLKWLYKMLPECITNNKGSENRNDIAYSSAKKVKDQRCQNHIFHDPSSLFNGRMAFSQISLGSAQFSHIEGFLDLTEECLTN